MIVFIIMKGILICLHILQLYYFCFVLITYLPQWNLMNWIRLRHPPPGPRQQQALTNCPEFVLSYIHKNRTILVYLYLCTPKKWTVLLEFGQPEFRITPWTVGNYCIVYTGAEVHLVEPNIQTMSEEPPVVFPNPCRRHQFCRKMRPPPPPPIL